MREIRGEVQLTRRWEDGSRSSVMLGILWNSACGLDVLNTVAAIRERVEAENLSLQEAHELVRSHQSHLDGPAMRGSINWEAIVEAYLASKADLRPTTLRDLRCRLNRLLSSLRKQPMPRSGPELMRRYAAEHFDHCPPGGQGRKRQLLDVAAFLRFAVQRHGVPSRWNPLGAEGMAELVGTSDRHAGDALTPPIKPEQLARLLDELAEAGNNELLLAVGLVSLYGLRPAELAVLRVNDGRLYVGQVKRNQRTLNQRHPPRLVLALPLTGREAEAEQFLEDYSTGAISLPRAIRSAIASGSYKAVGDAFRQLLDRNPTWQRLAAETPGLTPYSLRHGYAWRAHKGYERPLSVRDAAALMGHSPATHHRHYGRWTDEAGLLDAVHSLTGRVAAAAANAA
ncbi:hypothetical protein [Cyanobium sp. PCC 7001]|uniref:hypothetical protein n=1 Tax=Cyanobium sp. PCC 7001 TaxID=180281 RepID=UPI0002E07FD4|nr:hypothetical protein [Cyanobium sp. PCC 7001]